ncbi:MAG TPA: hypothetical protein VF432_17530 [Thermoanaerobaculia bacterium]
MGQLIMSFRGITMHVRKESLLRTKDVQDRVVPVNATAGFRGADGDWGDVPPHFCFLECAPDVRDRLRDAGMKVDDRGYIQMNGFGWHIRVLNARKGKVDFDLAAVPAMKDFLPGMVLKRGIGGAKVPKWAACFIDIDGGSVTAGKLSRGAIYTTWYVETEGDETKLQFTRTVRGKQEELVIPIPPTGPGETLAHGVPGSIVVHNGTSDDSDKKFDFVLHFLANAGGVPRRLQLDKPFPTDLAGSLSFVDLTTSCSNSQYP